MDNNKSSSISMFSHDRAKQEAHQVDDMSEVHSFSLEQLDELKVIHQGVGQTKTLKAFRDLRTQLLKRTKGKNYVCLVVASSSGGGTYVAANLSAAIALDKTKSALLIDCNLYSPSLQRYMPVDAGTGLTDYLDFPEVTAEDIVHASGIPRVRIVPVGNNCDGGTEKLASARMRNFLDEMKSRYDDRFIFLDAPPASVYEAEVSILADMCDFILLVVPAGVATAGMIATQIERLGKERIAGVVFNDC